MAMNKEFHIFASHFDTRFVMKAMGDGYPQEFRSLFEAARFARTQPDCEGGLMVIHDEDGRFVNRIPFLSMRTH